MNELTDIYNFQSDLKSINLPKGNEEEINQLLLENKNIALDYYNAKPSILSNDILNSDIFE